MKKLLIMLIAAVLALSVLAGCGESKNTEGTARTEVTTTAGGNDCTSAPATTKETAAVKKGISDYVTIKDAVNKEGVSPNGDKVKYVYQLPVINIDKPGAKKINDMFLNLEKDMENRIGNGQNMTLTIPSKAFLNDGIISIVMEIRKGGPGGIHAVNYDIENDKEIGTKELTGKFKFDPQKLIAEIDKQTKIDDSKPKEQQYYRGGLTDLFVDTVIMSIYPLNKYSPDDQRKKMDEMQAKSKEEKNKYITENIDKISAYINNDGKFVFVHMGMLDDEELTVE